MTAYHRLVMRVIAWWLAVLGFATLCWIAAFYATAWLFARPGIAPPPLWRQVSTSLLGLLFMACPMVVLAIARQPYERAVLQSITSVIRRIARGDFSARVDTTGPRHAHPLAPFVQSINSMAVQLDRMERLRQEFVANVSHEIGSPLTSISGFARALRDEELDAAARRRYLDIVLTESERLSRLSDNLLKLTALDEHPALERRPHRLDRQLRRVILAAEPQWTGKGLAVHADLAAVTVEADEVLLDQVWGNLIHNAVKFTPTGGAVTVHLAADGAAARVEVADTGVGISAEDQSRIFERFFKADRARNREAGGSGLGLALVRRILDLHGGSVTVASAPGEGATFTVVLPLRR